ncbi:MAG: peptidylprolyl isomerase [Spongiibacteraceae bacterium]|jgi:peptidyl-prolyl cis-trans isomerase C|nr:peptidylprolyl isomerase [Spongiibacteraceae bacterium]
MNQFGVQISDPRAAGTQLIDVVQLDSAGYVDAAAPAGEQSFVTPALPSACLSGGCGGGQPQIAPSSYGEVRVNGVAIAPAAIAEELQHHPGATPDDAWMAAARALAVRELLLQEAARRGMWPEPEVDDLGRHETDDDALIRALLEAALEPAVASEEECRRYYEARTERFRTPELFEASHILIEPEEASAAGWEAARQRACLIAAEVGDDAQAFAAAATEFSRCPTAQQGGSLGQVRRGELLAPVQAALEALTPGTASREPVRSPHGWHLLRLARRLEGRTLPFELVQSRIADMLEARAWSVSAAHFVATLASEARVEGVLIDPGF